MQSFRVTLLVLSIWMAGCTGSRKATYFNDIAATTGTDAVGQYPQLKIQPGDVLQITVSAPDKEVTQLFNPNVTTPSGSSGTGIDQGYLVDSAGYISLPVAGKLYVKDKTTATINEEVITELSKTLKNVYVSTRMVNFKVSVLGDVAHPGIFRIGAERASILDALSMAGDLNTTAVRNDVMVIREVDGVKHYTTLNLNSSKTLSSPYYYLANNDVVYVKPGPGKQFPTSRLVQLLPAILSVISLATTIVLLSR
ncbi:polysaccharide biosynthesis/export family protein [Chitinophaga qingshengii]|uniref:Polysaccharide biosynthesis/export family protein n=1 Tax=Chitinophaga qingshengii TaxID=1569794 RepID=A0ABR7TK33_9BACT|nr:polysaccharide biosynthesis/export family protein [Chitinophaga qingshengii]MBC9929409.1 polysaccharide biosynthesis/export family protein [Chitinophaga qingshengii]